MDKQSKRKMVADFVQNDIKKNNEVFPDKNLFIERILQEARIRMRKIEIALVWSRNGSGSSDSRFYTLSEANHDQF